MIKIGLNDNVCIRLTEFGANEINRVHKEFIKKIKPLVGVDISKLYRTNYFPNEMVEMQLSDVFNSFKECNFNTGGEIPFTLHIVDYYEELPQQIKLDSTGEIYDLFIEYNPGGTEGFFVGYDKPKRYHIGEDFKPLIVNGIELNSHGYTFNEACEKLYNILRNRDLSLEVIHIRKQLNIS